MRAAAGVKAERPAKSDEFITRAFSNSGRAPGISSPPASVTGRMSRPVRTLSAFDWLNRQPGAQDLAAQARRLGELQRDLDACAPVRGLLVTSLDGDLLVLTSTSAALAAKLRQFEPTLVARLNQRGWRVSRVRVRARPAAAMQPAPAPGPARPPLPDDALQSLDGLMTGCEEGPLRLALARLLRNQRRRREPGPQG